MCGDGLRVLEECDDDDRDDGDGCSSTCTVEPLWSCTGGSPSSKDICTPICGDMKVVAGYEQCDNDNSRTPNDGCDANCQVEIGWSCSGGSATSASTCTPICGDNKKVGSEACDNGATNGDGCSSSCQIEVGWTCSGGSATSASVCAPICGDNKVVGPEVCDNGATNGDGCSSSCQVEVGWSCTGGSATSASVCTPICGDNKVVGTEVCDNGPTNGDGCSTTCQVETGWTCTGGSSSSGSLCSPVCGDNKVVGTEVCDNGGGDGDGCSTACQVEAGWICTGGSSSSGSVCTPICGDNKKVGTEVCDNGGGDGDGCSNTCQVETGWTCIGGSSSSGSVCTPICGDAKRVGNEQCDNDNTITSGDGCDANCQVEKGYACIGGSVSGPDICSPVCGDSRRLEPFETCDDGNKVAGDGCDSSCRVELTYTCIGGDIDHKDFCTCGPQITSIRFADGWESLLIQYDRRIQVRNTEIDALQPTAELCDLIILQANLSSLGANYSCLMSQEVETEVIVVLGENATVLHEDVLIVNSGVMYGFGCTMPQTLKLSATVLAAPHITPQGLTYYAEPIGLCMEVNVTLFNKTLVGKRPLKDVSWTVTQVSSAHGSNDSKYYQPIIQQSISDNKHQLQLPPMALPINTNVTIKVTMTNFLNKQGFSFVTLKTVKMALPLLFISGPEIRFTYTYPDLTINSIAEIPTCPAIPDMSQYLGYSVETLQYEWSQLPGKHKVSTEPFFITSRQMNYLLIPEYSLKTNTDYGFALTAYPASQAGAKSYANTTLRIMPSKLYTYIKGGNRMASVERDLVLDGTLSRDPDVLDSVNASQAMNYSWICFDNTSNVCQFTNGSYINISNTSNVLNISKKTLPGNNYTFFLIVTKDNRKSNYSVDIDLRNGMTPVVAFDNPKTYINRNEPLLFSLRVWSRRPDSIQYKWNITENETSWSIGQNDSYTGFTRKTMKTRPWILPANASTVTVTINIIDVYGPGTASFVPTINEAPHSGSLVVSPPQGYSITTRFRLHAQGWKDIDIPLAYQFFYYYAAEDMNDFDRKALPLTELQVAEGVRTVLPSGESSEGNLIYLQVIVSDHLEARANISTNVKVTDDPSVNKTNYFSNLEKIPSEWHIQRLHVLNIVTKNRESLNNISLKSNCSCGLHGACNNEDVCLCDVGWYGSDCSVSKVAFEQEMEVVSFILTEFWNTATKVPQKELVQKIMLSTIASITQDSSMMDLVTLNSISQLISSSYEDQTTKHMRDHINSLSTLGSLLKSSSEVSSLTKVPNLNNQLYSSIQSLMAYMMKSVVPNEGATHVNTSNVYAMAKKVTPDLLTNNTFLDNTSSTYLQLPAAGIIPIPNRVSDQELPNDEQIYDLQVIEWNTLLHPIDSKEDQTKTISINLNSLNSTPTTHSHLNLVNPFVFYIPIKSTRLVSLSSRYACTYYNTSTHKWLTDGCQMIKIEEIEGVWQYACECTHMTAFAVFTAAAEDVYINSNVKYLSGSSLETYSIQKSPTFWILIGTTVLTIMFMLSGKNHDLLRGSDRLTIGRSVIHISYIYSKIKRTRRAKGNLSVNRVSWGTAIWEDFVRVIKVH